MIATPYLLYLGHSNDEIGIKTSRGLAVFRPDICVGEFRHDDCGLTLGLPRLDFAAAWDAGARTLVLGIANAGGRLGNDLVEDALAAMEAGLDIASGLHQRLKDEPRLVAAAARMAAEKKAELAAWKKERDELREQVKDAHRAERKRLEEKRRLKEENRKRTGTVYQQISNPRKLRNMSKKQFKSVILRTSDLPKSK